ncbi:S24 family peptidase [uncultured Peptoniphilus sp.]|uniref:LexA family protein n=1 Tax=uncultured Peptoniphilus sp. TaxID=254354 RepID=UPI002804B93B|nr:S24 family peptidase [uncultured Peptoniphilus sp.]
MNIGDRIKQKRLENKMTLEDLGKRADVNKATIQRYESGKITNIPSDRIERISEALGVSPAYLMGWEENIDLTKIPGIIPITKKKIPLLGSIACGQPIFSNEDRESYIEVGTDIKANFCLKCKGDSMINARINDGDIVFIRSQSIVDNGEIAAVIIDDEATLKRVYYHKENNIIELRPENPKYKSIIYTGEELDHVKILGKAIAFQSDVI